MIKTKTPKKHRTVRFLTPKPPSRRAPSASPSTRSKKTPLSPKSTDTVKIPSNWKHQPRSPTKKTCSSSQPLLPPPTPEVVDISETSTEYTVHDDPHAWRYDKNIPRRSFRLHIPHAQTPVLMKRAQKRKASGSSQPEGNPLLHHFPYLRLTLTQIEQLFGVYNIVLGRDTQDREKLISAIQLMDPQFDRLLQSLDFKVNDTHKTTHISLDHISQLAAAPSSGTHESLVVLL